MWTATLGIAGAQSPTAFPITGSRARRSCTRLPRVSRGGLGPLEVGCLVPAAPCPRVIVAVPSIPA